MSIPPKQSSEVLSQRARRMPRDPAGKWVPTNAEEQKISDDDAAKLSSACVPNQGTLTDDDWDSQEARAKKIQDFLTSFFPEYDILLQKEPLMGADNMRIWNEVYTDLTRSCVFQEGPRDNHISVLVRAEDDGTFIVSDYGRGLYYWNQEVMPDQLRKNQEIELISQICDNHNVTLDDTEGLYAPSAPYQIQTICEDIYDVPVGVERVAQAQLEITERNF